MRAFLLFRLAMAPAERRYRSSPGRSASFRRDALLEVGGYDRTSIGEDMDLTLRLHRLYRARRQPFRIAFEPDPLCWTQAPEDGRSLRSQRYRWRRGLLQVLCRAIVRMMGNPRYGVGRPAARCPISPSSRGSGRCSSCRATPSPPRGVDRHSQLVPLSRAPRRRLSSSARPRRSWRCS